jgi:hypothetical protein
VGIDDISAGSMIDLIESQGQKGHLNTRCLKVRMSHLDSQRMQMQGEARR